MNNLINSFKYAINGLKETLIHQRNFKAMALIVLIVIVAMFYFPTNYLDRAIIFTMIFSILILETINFAIEKILNFLQPQQDERVRIIKDLMAAIVLLASMGAAIVGSIIFWPYIF